MLSARLFSARVLVVLAAVAGLALVVAPLPAPAAPGTSAATDDEGGSRTLREALENASKGYTDARTRLDNAKRTQTALLAALRTTEADVARAAAEVASYGAEAYRGGGVDVTSALLDSRSVPDFADRAAILQQLTRQDDRKLADLKASRERLVAQKALLEAEIRVQQAQQRTMAKRKADAEKALAAVGSGVRTRGPGDTAAAPAVAKPAPRRADGSWRSESCSVDDPTSGACLTPRTANALRQARAAGYTRYTACFRQASFGEHPKGRACDFSASARGFGGTATGGDRSYGNRLAAYFLANADRLGVLYVIWYRQIWLPSTGWRSYSGGGSPSADHTNHVHLSVR